MHSKEKILELHNRNRIYEFISKYPGVHQRHLIKKINLSEGTIKYHLDFLTKKGYIDRKDMLGYTRFYPSKKIGKTEQEILSIFRQEIPRRILIYLICYFGVTISDLSKAFEKDKKTIIHHVKKLLELELIEPAEFEDGLMLTNRNRTRKTYFVRSPIGKEKIYRLKQPYMLYYFFIKYKESFSDDEITKNTLDYIEYISKDVHPGKYDKEAKVEDRIINIFFEIFPLPFCA